MAIQYAGGVNRNDLYAAVVNKNDMTANINTTLVAAGWTSEALNAFTVLTMTANPLNNETATVDGKVYTFKTVINNANDGEIFIDSDAAHTIANFGNAVNLGPGAGTKYSSATTLNTNLAAGTSGAGVVAFEYSLPGSSTIIVYQKAAGAPVGYTVSETITGGSWSTATVNWVGYKCTSATTPAGLKCRYAFFNAGDANVGIRNVAMNAEETSISNSFAGGEPLFVGFGVSVDLRVIANRYQCFVFQDGVAGATPGGFWAVGVPWIPDQLVGVQISAATNASPIAVTTSSAHGYTTGMAVTIRGVQGNLATNVTNNTITVTGTTTFTLDGTTGDGSYTTGGFVGRVGIQIVECIWAQGTSSGTNYIRLALQAGAYFTVLNGSYQKDGSGAGQLKGATIGNNILATTELMWFNSSFLVTEPLICMGTSAASAGKIVGQHYDMVFVRKAITVDTFNPPGSIDSKNWWNLTDNNTGLAGGYLGSYLHVIP